MEALDEPTSPSPTKPPGSASKASLNGSPQKAGKADSNGNGAGSQPSPPTELLDKEIHSEKANSRPRRSLSTGSILLTVALAVTFGVWFSSVLREPCEQEVAVIFRGKGRGAVMGAVTSCAKSLTSREALQKNADTLVAAVKTICLTAYRHASPAILPFPRLA